MQQYAYSIHTPRTCYIKQHMQFTLHTYRLCPIVTYRVQVYWTIRPFYLGILNPKYERSEAEYTYFSVQHRLMCIVVQAKYTYFSVQHRLMCIVVQAKYTYFSVQHRLMCIVVQAKYTYFSMQHRLMCIVVQAKLLHKCSWWLLGVEVFLNLVGYAKRDHIAQNVFFLLLFNLSQFQGHTSPRLPTWSVDSLGLLLHRSNSRS